MSPDNASTRPRSPGQKKSLFHNFITVLATLIVLGAISMGIYFFIFYRNHEQTNDAQVDQYVTPVISRITGYIQEVRFEENQFVHKGDTLVIIDPREFKSRLDMAEADLESAKQSIGVIQKGVAATQSNTGVKEAQLDAARAQLWKAEQDYKRYANLLKEEAVTEQQYEQVKANYESALAHYNEMERSIHSTNLSTAEAEARLTPATSSVRSRAAAVENAALYLSYTIITAPYDGWVGRKAIQPGQLVREGQTLVSVVSQEKWITANFKETQVRQLSFGEEVQFKADATGSRIYHGAIESFSPASGARFSLLPPDNSTGNFVKIEQRIPIRIRLTDDDSITRFLRAGMNVVVTVRNKK